MAKRLDYADPPPRRVFAWQFLVIASMVSVGVMLLGFLRVAFLSPQMMKPMPTSAPTTLPQR